MKRPQILLVVLASVAIALVSLACSKTASPTDKVKEMVRAIVKTDVEAYKKTISTRRVLEWEDEAKHKKKPINDYMKERLTSMRRFWPDDPDSLEMRGEAINGNTASVYVHSGDWFKVLLVKEDGEWKVDGEDNSPPPQ